MADIAVTQASCFSARAIAIDARRTLRLAMPLMAAQMLHSSNGMVDSLIAGRLGRDALAAGGIGAGIWFFSSLICIGLLAGLSPTLSKLIGEHRRNAVGAGFRQGLWLGLACGLTALLLNLSLAYSLPHWKLADGLTDHVRSYLYSACWGLPAFALVMVCRNVFEATGITRPVLLVQLLGVLVNILGNLSFGLGWFGFPKLGLFGIGVSTALVNLSMAAVLMVFLRGQRFRRYNLFAQLDPIDQRQIRRLLSLSIPIFFALLFEAGLFFATAVMMGKIGAIESAAHIIAITIAGFCYMLPLGMSFALTARVGHVFGRQAHPSVRVRVISGLSLMVLLAGATAIAILLSRHFLVSLFTDDIAVSLLAIKLLGFAAVFQLSDGAQAILLGLLRGLQDTLIPMLINAFSYWFVAFFLGYMAAYHWGMGAAGLWLGLVVGLSVSSILLGLRLLNRLKMPAHV